MLIRLADCIINIENLYPYTDDLCKEYAVDSIGENEGVLPVPDIHITTSKEDIDHERDKSSREDEAEGRPIRIFTDGYLESLAVYRKIAEKMPDQDTFLFHGSALAVGGEGYIFTAKSGTGKSTHARLWREMFGDRVVMVNDDKPLIRVTGDTACVYGTPWDGKHRLSSNVSVPVRAVCILERGAENSIEGINISDAMPMLIQQAYRPSDPAALQKTLTLIDKMTSCVKLYRMKCSMDPEAARVAYEMMKG